MSTVPKLFASVLTLLTAGAAFAREAYETSVPPPSVVLSLWPGLPSHAGEGERVSASGAVSHVISPHVDIYRPSRPNGAAVLIMGGGGYDSIGIGKEALPAAQWLESRGVTAAVLYYRLPVDGIPPVAPFQDAQRAMRLLRAQASRLGIDPERIGVMGFSAGGNLAGITETRFNDKLYQPVDDADRVSSRPDFAALLYPVISLEPPFNTTQTSKRLSAQSGGAIAYSVELHVTPSTPPTFLAHAEDDPVAQVGNSELMYSSLQRQGVVSELHLFKYGGHGWGLGKPGTEVSAWPNLFSAWASSLGFFPMSPVAGDDVAPAAPRRRHHRYDEP